MKSLRHGHCFRYCCTVQYTKLSG